MSTIRVRAEQYLAMRRALGFKLTTQGRLLLGFVGYLEQAGATRITTQAALAWATTTPHSVDQVWWSRRLMVVRCFARHLKALDPATQVPPDDVLPHHYRRQVPYLYSPDEITQLLRAADRLAPEFRALTWRSLICLLAVTGLRVGEACRLDRADVDLETGVLTIRDSKFGKSRQVPVHTTTIQGLRGYQQRRDELQPAPSTPGFFVSTRGTRLDAHNLSHTSPTWWRPPGSAWPSAGAAPACTTCATRLRPRPCWTGTATAPMSKPACPCCRPTWATPTRNQPTGI